LPGPDEAGDCLPFLLKLCKKRFRATDEIGWLDQHRVCAILPCTAAEGAWKVVEEICRSFPDNITPPLCTVHTFLSGPAKGNGQAGERIAANGDSSPEDAE